MIRLLQGDCRDILPTLEAGSVHCCVTSPPYLGLRDYQTARWEGGAADCDHQPPGTDRGPRAELPNPPAGWAGRAQGYANGTHCPRCGAKRIDRQIGLEPDPDTYIATLVGVFREVRRVLRDDGTLWCNMGDSYAGGGSGGFRPGSGRADGIVDERGQRNRDGVSVPGFAAKQLLMMPARVALALQADGWWLRSEIVWAKPNPMPESVSDRPTSAHEKVYLLSKRSSYYYDAAAVREESDQPERVRADKFGGASWAERQQHSEGATFTGSATRNLRNVWTLPTAPYAEAHFATFPAALASICIKAGCPPGGTVLDPFAGAGTTLLAADRLQRNGIGIELNESYATMARRRIVDDAPLLALMEAGDS